LYAEAFLPVFVHTKDIQGKAKALHRFHTVSISILQGQRHAHLRVPRVRTNTGGVTLGDGLDPIMTHATACRPSPKDVYRRPVLSSHTYGWGRNLEVFGPLNLKLR